MGHVNHSAIYLTMTYGLLLSYILSRWQSLITTKRIIFVLLGLLMLYGLIVGQSRGALAIALLLTSVLILFIPNSKKIKGYSLAFIGLIVCSMFIFKANVIEKQIANQKAHNVLAFRDLIWNTSMEAAHFYPIFGIGNGNWKHIQIEQIKHSVESRNKPFNEDHYLTGIGHSHNLYLMALVERGFVGFFALMTLMFIWVRTLFKNLPSIHNSSQYSLLWGGALSAWMVTFGVGFVNSTFHHEEAHLALLLLSIYLAKQKNNA